MSDCVQDKNTPPQVVMSIHGEKESVSNKVQDNLVSLIDGMQGGDV